METVDSIGFLILKNLVLPAVGVVLTFALAYVPKWLATKIKNERLAGIIERLTQLAFVVVSEVEQTVVTVLEKDAGGKAPADKLALAKEQAIQSMKLHLGPKGLIEIKDALGLTDDTAIERLISSFIEAAVHNLKSQEA